MLSMERHATTASLGHLAVTWSGEAGQQRIELQPGFNNLHDLKLAVCQALQPSGFRSKDFILTDGHQDITSDERVVALKPGDSLMVLVGGGKTRTGRLLAKETVSFSPHPKTLTMAGDYEYFAAQGHHPFAFALAELIDNALRATKGNAPARPRLITISLLVSEKGGAGLVRVQDNGCGMSKRDLNEWAVMNLSMEDRGLQRSQHQLTLEAAPPGGGRYLSGDLSHFGVGSKNAAFFLGQAVKLATRQADDSYVHELCITAAELERRFRVGAAVYEGDMVHRQPGDDSTLSPAEAMFPCAAGWVAEEVGMARFTRVTVGEVKEEVLQQMQDSEGVLRDLAHLYHYYLHGAQGNTWRSRGKGTSQAAGEQRRLPSGEPAPEVVVEFVVGARLVWRRNLADVEDDMETRYLRAARSKLDFTLEVPSRGAVEGVLWYFPFESDRETMPLDNNLKAYRCAQGQRQEDVATQSATITQGTAGAGPGQCHPAAGLPTAGVCASGPGSAAGNEAGLPTQLRHALQDLQQDQDEAGAAALQAPAPMFETFWQGRLIPGGAVDVLPFIQAVRSKRSTAVGRDGLPDQVFLRIRGALFFGPGFRVTRNKLTFRDNLAQLLSTAMPMDRNLEKKLKEWLVDCHGRLDRNIRFSGMADEKLRAIARRELGEGVTAFTAVSDGSRTLRIGDVVQLATKPRQVGRIRYFSTDQVVQAEGYYAHAFVTYCALPASVHGTGHSATVAMRRVEGGPISEAQEAQHAALESTKLPASLRIEPVKLGGSSQAPALELAAGSALPDTSVNVVNGAGARLRSVFYGGQKVSLRVIQRLMYLGAGRIVSPEGPRRTASTAPNTGARTAWEAMSAAAAAAAAAAALEPTATATAPAAAGGKKGGAARKRRRALKEGAGKENCPLANGAPVGARDSPSKRQEVAQGCAVATAAAADAEAGGIGAGGALQGAVAQMEALLVVQGEEVLSIENRTPVGDSFHFTKIVGGLTRAGTYHLLYLLGPDALVSLQQRVFSRTVIYVAAGTPCRFELQGEGRAVAGTKDIQLGEMLPPIRLAIFDSLGNELTAPPQGHDEEGWVRLEVLHTDPASSSAPNPVEELHSTWALVHGLEGAPSPSSGLVGGLALQDLYLLGSPQLAGGGAGGLELFAAALAGSPGRSNRSQAAQRSQRASVVAVDVWLAVHVRGLGSQCLPMRLVPGAPHSLKLRPGHPFGGDMAPGSHSPPPMPTQLPRDEDLVAACVMHGEMLPDFEVLALDLWGNVTCPTAEVEFQLQVHSAALDPATLLVDFDSHGVALVRGLRAGGSTAMVGERQLLASVESASGEGEVYILPGVTVGTSVRQLSCRFLDEAGRSAQGGAKGKLQLSWAKGAKKLVLDDSGEFGPLAPLRAGDSVSEGPQSVWVRFTGEGQWSGLLLEASLELQLVAGAPHHWSVGLVDFSGAAPAADAALSNVTCGTPFCLEIEVLDALNNRCSSMEGAPLPTPVVVPQADEGELVYDAEQWQQGWGQTQSGHGDLYGVKLMLGGRAGAIKLVVEDRGGPDGAAMLVPDELPLELGAGPAKALVVDGGQPLPSSQQQQAVLSCGRRGCLGSLRVRLVDSWDNTVETDKFEVALKCDAYSNDGAGHGIRVAATGSNRVKLRRGVALLRDVRLDAGQSPPGLYKLQFEPGSRKLDVMPATLLVDVRVHNLVTGLSIDPPALPDDWLLVAGGVVELAVSLVTEDEQPLPEEAAQAGLQLQVALSDGGRGDVVPLSLVGMPAADAALAACMRYLFRSPALTLAGTYTVVAEYSEQRPEVAALLVTAAQDGGPGSTVRSTSRTFSVQAGAPVAAAPDGPSSEVHSLVVTSAHEEQARRLLPSVAVQLRDKHGNPSEQKGVRLRWTLALPQALCEGTNGGSPGMAPRARAGSEAPVLEASGGDLEHCTDVRGRAFFGDLVIQQGTGRVGSSDGAGAATGAPRVLQLELVLHMLQPPAPVTPVSGRAGGPGRCGVNAPTLGDVESAGAGSSWLQVWSCSVSFSDDAERSARLQQLYSRRDELLAQGRALREQRVQADRTLDAAGRDFKRASRAVERALAGCGAAAQAAGVGSVAAAEGYLAELQDRQRASLAQGTPLEVPARFGIPRQPMTLAIQRCLTWGTDEVVGVLAQLGTVDDPGLSALLSYSHSSALTTLVVKTSEGGSQLRAALLKDNFAVPSYAPYTMLAAFREDAGAAQVAMRGLSKLAGRLLADACEGSDPPLALLLPHTKALLRNPQAENGGLPVDQYPDGFVGHVANLIRPVIPGHRLRVLSILLGTSLVFETLDQGTAYRQYVTQVLHSTTSDILTLDGCKIAGRGVVQGSAFRVPRLEESTTRFGSAPRCQVAAQAISEQIVAVEALLTELHQREAADLAVTAAQQAAAAASVEAAEEQAAISSELDEVKTTIAELAGGAARGGAGARSVKRQRDAATALLALVDVPEVVPAMEQNLQPAQVPEADKARPASKQHSRRRRMEAMQH